MMTFVSFQSLLKQLKKKKNLNYTVYQSGKMFYCIPHAEIYYNLSYNGAIVYLTNKHPKIKSNFTGACLVHRLYPDCRNIPISVYSGELRKLRR